MAKRKSLAETCLSVIKAGFPRTGNRVADIEPANKVRITSVVRYVLRTGIKTFDDRVGGFQFGRITEVFGLEGCGKSAMGIRAVVKGALKEICEVVYKRKKGDDDNSVSFVPIAKKKMDVHVLHVDNEQSVDENRNEVDGVTYHSLDIQNCRMDAIEDMFKMIDNTIKVIEQFQARAKKEKDDTLFFSVIVVDTIASTSSLEELSGAWDKRDFDRRSKVIHEGLRRLVRRVSRANVCLICLNQVHTKVQGFNPRTGAGANSLDNNYVSPGGMGLKYYSSNRIFMHKLQTRYRMDPKRKFPDGELIAFWAVKNRIMKPQRPGHMALLFGDKSGKGGGFSDLYSDLETMIKADFAEINSTGSEIKFKFNKYHVPMTTFGDQTLTLDEADEDPKPGRKLKDPVVKGRLRWPEFYAAHAADLDALYAACLDYALSQPVDAEEEEDEDLDVEEIMARDAEEDEEDSPRPRRRRVARSADSDESGRLNESRVTTEDQD